MAPFRHNLVRDASVAQPGDGQTWETAFKTIQQGIDAASDGDMVIVAPGIYIENIHFAGKNVILTSTDPLDAGIVAATIIDGNQSGPVVSFEGTEGETCVLSGFTIRNGKADDGGGICGGTSENRTHATIHNNVITGNSWGGLAHCDGVLEQNVISGNSGGGLYVCDGIIRGNTITENSAGSGEGGGLADCDGLVQNNIITHNSAALGGGLADCDGVIEGNEVSYNTASDASSSGWWRQADGGGLARCQALIQDNTISDNLAEEGGGLYRCDRTIRNNLITANIARWYAGGLAFCDGLIQNNVITHNSSPSSGAVYDCDGTIEKNTVTDNWPGGLFECDGVIQSNVISRNRADKGSYGGLAYCDGTVRNNLIFANEPGLYFCSGVICSNTIVDNGGPYSYSPGALQQCTGTITNCIIWGSRGPDGRQIEDSSEPTYSCIENCTGGGQGNISEDPWFVDPDGPDNDPETYEDNDYRLRGDSPCIDVGCNEADLPAYDLAGMHRVMYGGKSLTVDMGAYEYYINEVHAGPSPSETTLTWSSIAGSTYVILYSNDLLIWILAEAGIASAGSETTSWTDDGTFTVVPPSLAPCRFYRVLENP